MRFLDALNTSQQMQQLTHRMLGVGPGQRILDAGCGVGDVTRELASLVGPTGQVVGMDLIYLDDPLQTLGELLRVTRPGGTVVVFEPELYGWALDGPDREQVDTWLRFIQDGERDDSFYGCMAGRVMRGLEPEA
ncbi:MAG: class I SAM-dependent methyltransferase [Cystobacter sp.]